MAIIESILDTDLHKLTMQNAVMRLFPRAEVKYHFFNRGSHEFAQYVMDDWAWSDQFWFSNAMYSAAAAGEACKRKLL